MLKPIALALAAAALTAGAASAHHSFAVYFDDSQTVTITGAVSEFHFRNPHGTITLTATQAPEGRDTGAQWKAETNAPVILRRRGWTHDSLKAGDIVTITGWPARDGSNYMRVQRAERPDGSLVGAAPFAAGED